MDLAGVLDLDDRELVSFVGAGGKKTAMKRLVEQGRGTIRIGYTTTTHTPPPSDLPLILETKANIGTTIAEKVTESEPVAFATERIVNPARVDAKVKGFDPETIDEIFRDTHLDWILVKADGARMREFKAPGDGEPVVPSMSTIVVPVVSAKAFGSELSDVVVHRPELVADIADVELGTEITPDIVGQVIASKSGGLKHVPEESRVVPMVNKTDNNRERDLARTALETACSLTDRFDTGLVSSFERNYLEEVP